MAEVLKLPSLDSFEGVVLEIATNDLTNMLPEKVPPMPEKWGPDEIYTTIFEPISRAFYRGLQEIRKVVIVLSSHRIDVPYQFTAICPLRPSRLSTSFSIPSTKMSTRL